MRMTPLDIREQQFRRVMRGLDPEEVEAFLTSVAAEYETLLAERKDLGERVADLEERIQEYRSMEKALRDTLLTAEKVMEESKQGAQREAALIIREAEISAQRTGARLSQDLARMRQEIAEMRRVKDAYVGRVRWLLRSHLDLIEGHAQEFTEVDAGLDSPTVPGEITTPVASSPEPLEDEPHTPGLPEDPTLGDVLLPVSPDGTYTPTGAVLGVEPELEPQLEAEPQRQTQDEYDPSPPLQPENEWSMQRLREELGGGTAETRE